MATHIRGTALATVMRVYRRRTDELARRGAFTAPEAVPLGLLMLVPREVARG